MKFPSILFSLVIILFLAQPHSHAFARLLETPSPARSKVNPLQQNNQLHNITGNQLYKIIDAITSASDYPGWNNILFSPDSSGPMTATIFIPTNDAIAKAAKATLPNIFLFPYHVVPERLTFDDLRKYLVLSKLPTLLPTKFIVVTNDSAENFTINGARITHPDVYLTGSFSVHGVSDVLDYAVYGNGMLMENGMLAKNETGTRSRTMPGEKNESGVETSAADWLGVNIWITAIVACLVMTHIIG